MGRWFRAAADWPAELVDHAPGVGIGNPFWRCRGCGCAARLMGVYWCKRCADERIEARRTAPAEVARGKAIAHRLRQIDAALEAGAYDAGTLRRWYGWIDAARVLDVQCTRVTRGAVTDAMIETLPAVLIRVDSVLPFTSSGVFEAKVAEYMAARGDHRPVVLVGWPDRGERQLVDGRHRMSAALVLELPTIPAVFALHDYADRWRRRGIWWM